ncbi:hypothetical protein B0T17DRAFT_38050 [Bombardia bombarda]|uniref:F-box domain-containing protein n=1 Tax=Bombardia bombarda TaxID=252184 RepID=A0AA40CEA7_9PEZI|nr:hypothetical protein B0T17DRAFT_38050 [Bombardia bombarda]
MNMTDSAGMGDDAAMQAKIKSKLDDGRTCMKERVYTTALTLLMKAASMCPCSPASHGKDKSCNILQCAAAVKDADPDALYHVARGPCSCGFQWPSCTRPLHIQAVDTLAECLERARHYLAAFSTALGLVRLDPASAVGYCRVAKILRYLLRCHQNQDLTVDRSLAVIIRDAGLASANELRGLITLFIKSGLHNTQKYRHSPDDKYHIILRKMAHNLNMAESLRDPIQKLPAELLGIIFSYLDTADLCRCTRVNKLWKQVVLSDKMLWRHIRMRRPKNPGRYFANFLKSHTEARSLVIDDMCDFSLTETKLRSIALFLPRLERLCLSSSKSFLDMRFPTKPLGTPGINLKMLTQLSLISIPEHNFQTVRQLIHLTHASLEVLDIKPITHDIEEAFMLDPMPKLKRLRIIGNSTNSNTRIIEMQAIANGSPNLEHLHLDGLYIVWSPHLDWNQRKRWPALRSLYLGERMDGQSTWVHIDGGTGQRVGPIPLNSSMQSIEILYANDRFIEDILFVPQAERSSPQVFIINEMSPPSEWIDYPNLEVFRCRTSIRPSLLQRVIGSAAKNGTLRVLEVTATSNGVLAFPHCVGDIRDPADELAFAASEHVHTLGMYQFNWAAADNHYSVFNGQPFLDLLNLFPNAETIAAYPGKHANTAPFLMKLIAHPQTKAVYQENLEGVEWDEACKLAKKNGVQLYHQPKFRPGGWPLVE